MPRQEIRNMPKLKTNKAAAKRFKRTGTGKFKRHKAYKRHLLTSKTSKRRRNLRRAAILAAEDKTRIQRLLPYG